MTGRPLRDEQRAGMHQTAPYPQELAELVGRLRYRHHLGWEVKLEDDLQRDKPGRHAGEARGLTLAVTRCGPNTYDPEQIMAVNHYFPVPAATYNRESWMRWLFDRLGDVDTHERMEDFALWPAHEDGRPYAETPPGGVDPVLTRPYAPVHKPGWDPYMITVLSTAEERDTDFRGNRVHPETTPPEPSRSCSTDGVV